MRKQTFVFLKWQKSAIFSHFLAILVLLYRKTFYFKWIPNRTKSLIYFGNHCVHKQQEKTHRTVETIVSPFCLEPEITKI